MGKEESRFFSLHPTRHLRGQQKKRLVTTFEDNGVSLLVCCHAGGGFPAGALARRRRRRRRLAQRLSGRHASGGRGFNSNISLGRCSDRGSDSGGCLWWRRGGVGYPARPGMKSTSFSPNLRILLHSSKSCNFSAGNCHQRDSDRGRPRQGKAPVGSRHERQRNGQQHRSSGDISSIATDLIVNNVRPAARLLPKVNLQL